MKKRIYSIIIAVVLMLSSIAAPTKVSALEIPYRVDVTKYTSDEANASAQIREQVKAHANTVTVYVRTKDKDLYAVFNRIWNNAFAETTNPDEGDYLYWQMSSMAASYNALMRKEKGSNTYYTKYTINVDYFISLEQEQMLTQELNIINESFGFTETTTDYEKVKTIYDYICHNVTYDYSDSVEKGMVISQTVEPGTKASAGTSISITVSNGPKPEEKIEIQNFVGQPVSALKSWAVSNGININETKRGPSNTYPEGYITSMTPSSGTISKGGTISYEVSSGAGSQDSNNTGNNGDNSGNSGNNGQNSGDGNNGGNQ